MFLFCRVGPNVGFNLSFLGLEVLQFSRVTVVALVQSPSILAALIGKS